MSEGRILEGADGELVIQQSLAAKLDSIQTGQTAGFAEMRIAIANKADRSDMARLDGDLVDVKMRLGVVESALKSGEREAAARFTRKEKFWGGVAAVGLLIATVISPFLANLGH